MNQHSSRARRPAARLATALLVAGMALAAAIGARAQTPTFDFKVEAENFLPNGNRGQIASGPNGDKVGPNGKDWGIVTVDSGSQFSGGFHIGYFDATDWLEYDANVTADGLYDIYINFASGNVNLSTYPIVVTDWTTGSQVIASTLWTGDWGTYQTNQLTDLNTGNPVQLAMKQGVNRIRIQIRPNNTSMASGMNMDYLGFVKTGAASFANAVTGTVTTTVGSTATPLQGAWVYEGTDPNKASAIARTDANGNYTLYLPAGSHSLTAFYNGMASSTASVSAPGTKNWSLTYNGRIEAELLDSTNPGYANSSGFEPEYDPDSSTPLSNGWQLVGAGPAKYADYNAVVVPTAGVYDLSMFYAGSTAQATTSPGMYSFQVNGSLTKNLTFPQTYKATDVGATPVYANSDKILLYLNQGLNRIHMVDTSVSPFKYVYANVDYFTLLPSTQAYGNLVVKVNTTSGTPVAGASVQVLDASNNNVASGVTAADGSLIVPLVVPSSVSPTSPAMYTVNVTKSGANGTGTGSFTVSAPPQTVNVPISLAIQGVSVEAESFTNSGPNVPAADIVTDPNLSGGAYVSALSGFERPEWLEWTVNVPADGLYQVAFQYATLTQPIGGTTSDLTIWAPGTGFQERVTDLPFTGGEWASGTASLPIPLKAGPNTLRITANDGTYNLDYLTLLQTGALPTLQTITGTITGTDGQGTAPVGGAAVYVSADQTLQNATALAYTDNNGNYTISIPSGSADLNVSANGFVSQTVTGVAGGSTKNLTLATNNPAVVQAPAEQVEAEQAYLVDQTIQTTEGKIHNGQPGGFFELLVNAPRSGTYKVGMNYGSNWPTPDQRIHMTFTVNGVAGPAGGASVPTNGDYNTMVFVDNVTTVNLNAGPNRVRVTFTDGVANVDYLTFARTGGIVVNNPTDINNSGKTDIVDATIYARRLAGLDPGPKPDLNGDGVADAKDVQTILKVAGGLS